MPNEQMPCTHELAMTICGRIAEGESLGVICADAGMPDRATILGWIERNQKFRELYEFARTSYADDLAFEALEIADDLSISLADARLRMDIRRWLATRIAPSKYGTES